MAKPFTACSIDGCNGNASPKAKGARGWCNAHYTRWRRHGDPLSGTTRFGEPERFLAAAISTQGDDCLIWPFCRDGHGYAMLRRNGVVNYVSRVVCEAANGAPPSSMHQAAHSCGNGAKGCVNPRHIRWATRSQNEMDKVSHGTSKRGEGNHNAKLTEANVRQIRKLRNTCTRKELADTFGVQQPAIDKILCGQRWGWLK